MAATHGKEYILQADAPEILAGDNQALRRADGKPNLEAISVAAGQDRTTLWRITAGKIGLSVWAMAGFTELLMTERGCTRIDAEGVLYDFVDRDVAAARREAVSA
jgi:hypothetical protein